MGKKLHYMLSVDKDNLTGICSFCGPVKVRHKRSGYLCHNSQRRWSGRGRNDYTHRDDRVTFQRLMGASCETCDSQTDLVPDHSHATGAFRGTLCRTCNLGIGLLKDNPDILLKAVLYLQKAKPAGV